MMFAALALTWIAPGGLAAEGAGSAPADPARGKAIYGANCTACHGVAGDGKGPAAIALQPRPTDFTRASWWTNRQDAELAATIRVGKPGTSMTAFATLSDADVADLVAYLRTLPVAAPTPTP
jgi:high-affinity iron transporter